MSLYANIKFNKDLIENETCNITYFGYLFEKNSTSVSIVYGFGPEWKHTTEQKMEKTDEGFVATINIREFETINFCFKNLDNEWDNNYNQNYTSPISKHAINETQETIVESTPEEYDFILNNDNVITTILENLLETDLSNPVYNQSLQINTELAENQENIDVSPISENFENTQFEVEVEINEPVNIEETLVNVVEAESLNKDLENIFNELYDVPVEEVVVENIIEEQPTETNIAIENIVSEQLEENLQNTVIEPIESIEETKIENFENDNIENNGEFDMNNLINEILSPIVKSSEFDEDVKSSLESYTPAQNNSVNFFDDFQDFEEDSSIDNKIDSLIADLFNNTKEARKKIENPIFENFSIEPQAPVTDSFFENKEIQEESNVNEKIVDVFENINGLFEKVELAESEEPEEIEEESLIEEISSSQNDINETTALIELPEENSFTVSPRSLGKFYMFKKKIKLAFTKLFVAIPRYLSKGLNNENN